MTTRKNVEKFGKERKGNIVMRKRRKFILGEKKRKGRKSELLRIEK